jgi:hypothetical protein
VHTEVTEHDLAVRGTIPDWLDGRSLLLSRLFGRLLLRHAIQCRHHGTFLAEDPSARQAGNTVRSTVPNGA